MNDTPSSTGHQLTEHVKLLQKVALLHDGRVLLLKRAEDAKSRPSAWDLPGGNSEWPAAGTESQFGLHVQDSVREVREETGIELEPTVFTQGALTYCNTFFDAAGQVYSLILGWHVVLPAGADPQAVELSSEHTEFAWVPLAQLADYDFGGAKGEFVREIAGRALDH